MKKRIVIFFTTSVLIAFTNIAYSQKKIKDTLWIVNKHNEEIKVHIPDNAIEIPPNRNFNTPVFTGTTFIPGSRKTRLLENEGIKAISLEMIERCDENTTVGSFKDYPKIKKIERTKDNKLIIDVIIMSDCCIDFLGEASINNNKPQILELFYTSYGRHCACFCCYTLRYVFDTTNEGKYSYSSNLKAIKIDNKKFKIPAKK